MSRNAGPTILSRVMGRIQQAVHNPVKDSRTAPSALTSTTSTPPPCEASSRETSRARVSTSPRSTLGGTSLLGVGWLMFLRFDVDPEQLGQVEAQNLLLVLLRDLREAVALLETVGDGAVHER